MQFMHTDTIFYNIAYKVYWLFVFTEGLWLNIWYRMEYSNQFNAYQMTLVTCEVAMQ